MLTEAEMSGTEAKKNCLEAAQTKQECLSQKHFILQTNDWSVSPERELIFWLKLRGSCNNQIFHRMVPLMWMKSMTVWEQHGFTSHTFWTAESIHLGMTVWHSKRWTCTHFLCPWDKLPWIPGIYSSKSS